MAIPVISGLASGLYRIRVPKPLRNARRAEENALRKLRMVERECARLRLRRNEDYFRARERAARLARELSFIRRNPEMVESMYQHNNPPLIERPARLLYELRRGTELRAIDAEIKLRASDYRNSERDLDIAEKKFYKIKKRLLKAPPLAQMMIADQLKIKRDHMMRAKEQLQLALEKREEIEGEHSGVRAARIGEMLNNPYRDMDIVNLGPQSQLSAGELQADYNHFQYMPQTTTPPPTGIPSRYSDLGYPILAQPQGVYQNPKRGMNEFMRFAAMERRKFPKPHSLKEGAAIMKQIGARYRAMHGGARHNPDISFGVPVPFTAGLNRKRNSRTAFFGTAAILAVVLLHKMGVAGQYLP